MSGFTFGDPRFPTCCGRPQGCTNTDAGQCPFWNHRSKRTNDPDHPNHIPEDQPQGKDRDDMSETEHLWEAFLGRCTCGAPCERGDDFKAHIGLAPAPAGDSGGERG